VSNDWSILPGVDLHLDLASSGSRRASLERALRDAIRSGRLAPHTRLPSTRTLAAELGLARGTVAAAYDQLVAEGFLTARTGSGTTVAALAHSAPPSTRRMSEPAAPRFDLRPGSPDVSLFPVNDWLRSLRRALARVPVAAYDYGDPCGHIELRRALAEYLGRARGVLAAPDRIVVTSGSVQALALLARVIAESGEPVIAMEDPGLAYHREVVCHAGAQVTALPVDDRGARTDLLSTSEFSEVRAVVVTPAHQYPVGVTLHPQRRLALTAWARERGGIVIEDDYDGEFRYDRQPVGALQGMAPEHVAYLGSASKTVAPGLRLAWLVLPEHLVQPVARAKRLTDLHTETIGQLALAEFITSHGYDRHIRACRSRYRRRRDLLVARFGATFGRQYALHGIAAGLHGMVTLPPEGPTEAEVLAAASARGLAVGELGSHWHEPGEHHRQAIIVGYGTSGDASFAAALDTLVRTLRGRAG